MPVCVIWCDTWMSHSAVIQSSPVLHDEWQADPQQRDKYKRGYHMQGRGHAIMTPNIMLWRYFYHSCSSSSSSSQYLEKAVNHCQWPFVLLVAIGRPAGGLVSPHVVAEWTIHYGKTDVPSYRHARVVLLNTVNIMTCYSTGSCLIMN